MLHTNLQLLAQFYAQIWKFTSIVFLSWNISLVQSGWKMESPSVFWMDYKWFPNVPVCYSHFKGYFYHCFFAVLRWVYHAYLILALIMTCCVFRRIPRELFHIACKPFFFNGIFFHLRQIIELVDKYELKCN